MHPGRERRPACGFCDGTGLWTEADGDLATADPCPLCDGTGAAPSAADPGQEPQVPEAIAVARVLAILPKLTQSERQKLYEELYSRYDCRIYRG